MQFQINEIGRVSSPLKEKFSAPKQSQIAPNYISTIIFQKEFSDENMFRGLEQFSHIWVIWIFSENLSKGYKPTVRPPKLGGNKRMGVFATRSSFRPNSIAMTLVKLNNIYKTDDGLMALEVSGGDFIDNTPVVDIKPYIHYDSLSTFNDGFAEGNIERLKIDNKSVSLLSPLSEASQKAIIELLSCNPRPAYQDDSDRIYKVNFDGFDVHFKIDEDNVIITDLIKHNH